MTIIKLKAQRLLPAAILLAVKVPDRGSGSHFTHIQLSLRPEVNSQFFHFGPHLMTLWRGTGDDELHKCAIVFCAGGILFYRILKGLPIRFPVVVLVDEHPYLLVRIVLRIHKV